MERKMMGGLDTAETARQPQESDPDQKMFDDMTAGLREHIFGKGEQGIVEQMKQADDKGRVLGEITFTLVREGAHQAEQQQMELSYDVLVGVATEVIDDIAELMQAYGMQINDSDREKALMYAQQLYVDNYKPQEGEQEEAKSTLAQMQGSPEMHQAVSYVQQRGAEEGQDPFGVAEMDADQPQMMERPGG